MKMHKVKHYSEHLTYCSDDGHLYDLLPIPFTEEAPEQATYLVVYRNRSDEVHFLEINPVTARLISLLQENETYTGIDAIEDVTKEMNHPNPELVKQGGLTALQELQRYGVILGSQQ